MNREEIAKILAVCAAAYPQVVISKETAIIYADNLWDLDYAATLATVRRLVSTSKWFPTVAEIRRALGESLGIVAPDAATAYGEVIAAAAGRGLSDRPDWSHPAIDEVVKAVGWRRICLDDNPPALRSQFMRLYEPIRDRHDRAALETPPRLAAADEALESPSPHRLAAPRPVQAEEAP